VHRNLMTIVVLAATGTLTACGIDAGRECSGAAVRKGISLDIDAVFAPKVADATLTSCWGGTCTDTRMHVMQSSASSPLPCTGTGPDAVCGAAAVPTGEKNGFADLPAMTDTPGEVTLRLVDSAGVQISAQALVVTPKVRYPGGPECGGGTPQGGLTVSADGTVTERA
jgi:hypothetical protein